MLLHARTQEGKWMVSFNSVSRFSTRLNAEELFVHIDEGESTQNLVRHIQTVIRLYMANERESTLRLG